MNTLNLIISVTDRSKIQSKEYKQPLPNTDAEILAS